MESPVFKQLVNQMVLIDGKRKLFLCVNDVVVVPVGSVAGEIVII